MPPAPANVKRYNTVTTQLPEMPCTLPNHPKAEEEIRQCMGGDGVTEAVLPADQSLINNTAKDSGQPLMVLEAEEDGGDQERPQDKFPERDALEIGLGDIAIKKRAEKDFFEGRHDQGGTDDSDQDEHPC